MLSLLALLPALSALEISKQEVKILQLTDLHYGEGDLQDLRNNLLVADLLDWEKPDLVVITGDLVSGYRWQGQDHWFESLHAKFVQPLEARNIPWAYALGNHDTEGDLIGDQIVEIDRNHTLSLMGEVKRALPHSTNYYVVLRHASRVPLVLWLLDTGNRNHCELHGYDCLHHAQLEWQRNTHRAMEDSIGHKIPGIAFMHIPPPEYIDLWNSGAAKGHRHEDVACWASGKGTFASMHGLIGASVGHDHFNDYEGTWDGIKFYYGRKTGFGGNGPDPFFERGARVFSYNFNTSVLESWIRTEGGKVYKPSQDVGLGKQETLCAESSGYSLAVHHTINFIKALGLVAIAAVLLLSVRHYSIFRQRTAKDHRFEI
mmetsp:Transcript_23802/g.42103  ORF Transcript_23802/g.42103 Transcript_23802/m.42103 type:complete len:373 (-) Transcript_23802:1496-2614(-)